MPPYTKPPTTAEEQYKYLLELGLEIPSQSYAEHFFAQIGYYRLKGYALQFRDLSDPKKPFIPGTSFQDILDAHEADHRVRSGLFTVIQRLELAVRAAMSEVLSLQHGAHWYSQHDLFRDRAAHAALYAAWVNHFWKQQRELFVRHFGKKYGPNELPPSWMLLETMTIGNLSKAFQQLRPSIAKDEIAARFGLKSTNTMASWLHSVAALRNIICHHNRLWDAEFRVKPELFAPANDYKGSSPITGNHLLGAQAYVVTAMMRAVSPPHADAVVRVLRLVITGDTTEAALLRNGFKPDWYQHEHFAYRYFESDSDTESVTAGPAVTED